MFYNSIPLLLYKNQFKVLEPTETIFEMDIKHYYLIAQTFLLLNFPPHFT